MMNEAEFDHLRRCEETMWWFRGMREIVRSVFARVPPPHGALMLDAGCGTSHFAQWLEGQTSGKAFGIDLSHRALLIATRELGFSRGACADLRALPFPTGRFPLVTCMDVLVHFPAGEEALPLQELARVLAPGGLLLVRVAAHRIFRSRHSEWAGERQRFVKATLEAGVRHAGLEVLFSSYANMLPAPAALLKFRVWEPLLRCPPASGVQPFPAPLDALLYGALRLEAAWIRRGGTLPFGQSLLVAARKPISPAGG